MLKKAVSGFFILLVLSGGSLAQQTFEEWLEADQQAYQKYQEEVTRQYEAFYEAEVKAFKEFVRRAGETWGKDNVWIPEKKVWVQYADDFEERSSVDFEQGMASVQIVVPEGVNVNDPVVQERLRDAVATLVLSGTESPVQMVQRQMKAEASAVSGQSQIYVVQKGDTLWGVSRRFHMTPAQLARANGLDPNGWLKIGQRLTIPSSANASAVSAAPVAVSDPPVPTPVAPVPVTPPASMVPAETVKPPVSPAVPSAPVIPSKPPMPVKPAVVSAPVASPVPVAKSAPATPAQTLEPPVSIVQPMKKVVREPSRNPVLGGQVKTASGAVVTPANAAVFAGEQVAKLSDSGQKVKGADGVARQAFTVKFPLVPEHLRVRAERFRPEVLTCAAKYKIDPALIFALMQTESAFNPRAQSGAPAYGLMQLVPRSGARDAYLFVHGEDKFLGPDYLFDPKKNIELGIALLHILDKRYLKPISDDDSRTFCMIAAYNTGAGNVSRAFVDGTSVKRAAEVINRMKSRDVYIQLRSKLPYDETRQYVKKVCERMPQYADWR